MADRTVTGFALFFYSMPTFLLGELCLLILFYQLHLAGITFFPGSGYVPLTQDPAEWFRHLVPPRITIALSLQPPTRASPAVDAGGPWRDYIRTARSKGIREQRVVYRHALRSALTGGYKFGIDPGTLLGGIIVTETVFGLPGLGQEITTRSAGKTCR